MRRQCQMNTLLKKSSIFANLLMEKPDNSFTTVKMWKKHLRIYMRIYICLYIYIRLQHMRRAIARARLLTRLKHWTRAKKSMPCLIKKASRRVADRSSKTTTFLIFHFLWNTKILRENHVYLFVISLIQWWKLYFQKQPPEVFYIKRCS